MVNHAFLYLYYCYMRWVSCNKSSELWKQICSKLTLHDMKVR